MLQAANRYVVVMLATLWLSSGLSSIAFAQPETETETNLPPELVERVDAIYPDKARSERLEGRVELRVTIGVDGKVGAIEVLRSAGPELDAAAMSAISRWRFRAAMRAGVAVESRIKIPFDFQLPAEVPVKEPEPKAEQESSSQDDDVIDVTVEGERQLRAETRGASDFKIGREVITAAPRQEGAEILRSAPGVYIGRGEGPAVAHNYMLRGFDAEHGQDIEFHVGGLPINLPSHIHGQGYSDLGFLIGDSVLNLDVTEGVYDPRQGDFAVAGSIDIGLGVAENERGLRLRSSYGAFNTFKQLLLWAPEDGDEESFAAAQFMHTDGFGQNRRGQSGSIIAQHRFGGKELSFRLIGIAHAARSDMAGVLRRDDIDAGNECFTCVYPEASATAQNALSMRSMLGFFIDYEGEDGDNGQLGIWAGYDSFRMQRNFTGFLQASHMLERVAGRGDLIDQQNGAFSIGLRGRYRTSPFRPFDWAAANLELGVDSRLDVIEQSQNLIDAAVRNQTWDRRIDAGVRAGDIGLWGDIDVKLAEIVRARLGFRADVLAYDVEDRLGNFVPKSRPHDSFLVGYRRSAFGVAAGPRASLQVETTSWLKLLAAYGEGYRSPQARMLQDGERAPFSKVRSADIGARFDFGDPLQFGIAGYYTHLSDDIAFDASEGKMKRIGATQRLGFVVHALSRPWPWLLASASLTFVDATLLEAPPPTAEQPNPPFEDGQNIPFVPPLVLRVDLSAKKSIAKNLGGHDLLAHAGLGFSMLSSRPLPHGEFAAPVALMDLSAGLAWNIVDLSLNIFNLFDAEYAAVEYSFASDWSPNDGVRSRLPARHISAGSPLTWMLSLGVKL